MNFYGADSYGGQIYALKYEKTFITLIYCFNDVITVIFEKLLNAATSMGSFNLTTRLPHFLVPLKRLGSLDRGMD